MDNLRKSMIEELMNTLKIPQGNFNFGTIADELEHISNDNLKDFYRAVMSAESYGNGMKAIIQTAESFKPQQEDLLVGTREQAKAMYDAFYARSRDMLDYCTENRGLNPSDREFFEIQDYSKMFNKQELYVFNELGGFSWLIDIKLSANSKVVIDKIENIIKRAITTKYLNTSNAIENKRVSKMLQGAK